REGTVWPKDGMFAVSGLSGSMLLTPTGLTLTNVRGHRGDAELTGKGEVRWPQGAVPQLSLEALAKNLSLDASLYQLLSPAARSAWDAVGPEGTVDVDIRYSGAASDARVSEPSAPLASVDSGPAGALPADVSPTPAIDPGAMASASSLTKGFSVTIHPRTLAVTPRVVPYRLEDVRGMIRFEPECFVLDGIAARHGKASITLSGRGTTGKDAAWDLRLAGRDVPVDAELFKALPATLSGLLESLKIKGAMDFDFSKLTYRDVVDAEAASPATSPAPGALTADVDFATKITVNGIGVDVGVPLDDVRGTFELAGQVRDGSVGELDGKIDLESLRLADRTARRFRATVHKPAGEPALQLGKMQAELAGGELAGQVDLAFPEGEASRYAINLVLRNADVRELAGERDRDIRGRLNASLALAGNWSDLSSRRGRGDVSVEGKEMYRIPLVLGLLQITNLALPITKPFNEATSRYSVDGQRVTFEQIDLRSQSMSMQGNGHLDFGTKKVRMTFTTDAGNWAHIPFIGDFMQGARNELLQIHVRGSLEEPKVSAQSMNTFQTTVDEVFKGSGER
ncbi:MAG: hypothetical protein ACREIT_02975, partial [Tepidisphaeraceae bacterium]